jgi:hypothetical protein
MMVFVTENAKTRGHPLKVPRQEKTVFHPRKTGTFFL